MAGTQINNYSQSDSNILELQLTSDQSFKGKHLVSLTNYNNTSLPAVAAGSVIEVNGALYKFASEEAITGSPSDGTVYVYIDPATITAVFTNTAPTWSDSKQGYYGTSGTANCRYLEFVIEKSSSTYVNKRPSSHNDISNDLARTYITSNGTWLCPKSKYYDIIIIAKGQNGATGSTGAGGSGGNGGGYGEKRLFIPAGTVITATFGESNTTFIGTGVSITIGTGSNASSGYDFLVQGTNGSAGTGSTQYTGGAGGRSAYCDLGSQTYAATTVAAQVGNAGEAYGGGGSGGGGIGTLSGGAGGSGIIRVIG